MSSEFYNNPRRYKQRNRKRGNYKPRSMTSGLFSKVLVGVLVAGVIILSLMWLLPLLSGGRVVMFGKADSTPEPTETPKAVAHPIENVDVQNLAQDVVVADTAFQWFADATSFNGKMMFAGGELTGSEAYMTGLFEVSTKENDSLTAKRINVVLENDHIMYPVFNDSWLVYLDAKETGGGQIKCCKKGEDLTNARVVKEVYTGHPVLFLSGNNLAWTERTGTSMDKLYLCDLSTMESATVQMFNKVTYYGVSKPHLFGENLVWADVDTEKGTDSITAQICLLNITSGEFLSYKPKMYAHDPKSNGTGYIGWLTGNHGIESDLYIAKDMGDPECVAKGVVDFYIDDTYVAYQKDECVFVYIFETKNEYKISKKGQAVQLMGAADNCVMWTDVTSRTREIPQFAIIPN